MAAKRNNPGMFVSAWQADENDINLWTNDQIKGMECFIDLCLWFFTM